MYAYGECCVATPKTNWHKYRGLLCLHTFVVWNLECSRWGIIWIVLALLASLKPFTHFAHLCLQIRRDHCSGFAIPVYESEEQKGNRISKMSCSYKSWLGQNHLVGIACIQHHQQGCQLVEGSLPGPVVLDLQSLEQLIWRFTWKLDIPKIVKI